MKPHLIAFSTMTIDGKIASKTRFSRLSCPHDLRRLHQLRAECDAVMIGANTVIIDDPSLKLKYVQGKDPARIVIDGRLRAPVSARIFAVPPETIVFTTKEALLEKVEMLRRKGVNVIIIAERPPIDMRIVMEKLWELGYRRVMAEGGGELLWSLFQANVVDEVRVTIAPFIFGGRDAISFVMGEGFSNVEEAVKLKPYDVMLCECGLEVHIRYIVLR